jgi:hypothetical protein
VEADLSRAVWHKSTFSNGNGGNCVEAARNLPGIVAVRDSKNPDGPALVISDQAWSRFVQGIKRGELDF